MPGQKRMTLKERNKHLENMQAAYRQASRKEKGLLLSHLEQVTGLGRKRLIDKLSHDLTARVRAKQRGREYGPEVDDALRVIAESLDHITAERLTPVLVEMAEALIFHGELRASAATLTQLGEISIATVGRILRRIQQDEPHLPRSGPQEANRAREHIPTRRIPWNESEPGHLEADLVHHSGPSTKGDYVHTIQLVDVATGWSERVAVLGRSYLVMEDGFRRIAQRMPFPAREIHPDNGAEFFNHHMLRFWPECFAGVTLSRSRPWIKNDNRFVEQKNSTLVRRYLGNQRLDTVPQTHALNRLYDLMWTYYNFFQPVMRLQQKEVFSNNDDTKRVRRRFDTAQTPFERLCATGVMSAQEQQEWRQWRHCINPRQLRRDIYQQIDVLFSLPGLAPGAVENVRDSLTITA